MSEVLPSQDYVSGYRTNVLYVAGADEFPWLSSVNNASSDYHFVLTRWHDRLDQNFTKAQLPFELIILDRLSTDVQYFEAIGFFRKHNSCTPILIIHNPCGMESYQQYIGMGVYDCIDARMLTLDHQFEKLLFQASLRAPDSVRVSSECGINAMGYPNTRSPETDLTAVVPGVIQEPMNALPAGIQQNPRSTNPNLSLTGDKNFYPSANDAQLQLLLDGLGESSMYILDVKGKIVRWHSSMQRNVERISHSLSGKHVSVLYPEKDIAAGLPQQELLLAEKFSRYEKSAWRLHSDGNAFWANVAITAMYTREYQLCGYFLVLRDMSAQKKSQEEIQAYQQNLRARADALEAINSIADRVYRSLDIRTVVEQAVDAMLLYTGSPSVGIFGINEKAHCLELLCAKGFDEDVVRSVNRLPLKNSLTAIAISELKVVTSKDLRNDKRIDANAKEVLKSKPFKGIVCVPLLFQDRVFGAMDLLFKQSYTINEMERETLLAIGKTIGLAMANATHVAQLEEEVAKRKLIQEKERQRMLELAHVSRLSTMGEMATEIAHEVNQPLTAISTYSKAILRLLRNNTCDIGELSQALEAIAAQAQRAGEVIRRLREFVSKQESQWASTDLNELVRTTVRFVNVETRAENITIALDLEESIPEVVVDRILVEQVVLNLLRNAIDAVGLVDKHSRRIEIQTKKLAETYIAIGVKDSGPGLTPELEQKVFEPFYTTKKNGMGMGLSICQSIIEAHNGELWYARNSPCGAIFQLTIPFLHGDEN